MANEVLAIAPSDNAMYFVRLNSIGQVALSDGSAFENWGASGHDADDYDVALIEVGTGGCAYIGSFGSVAAGIYIIVAFIRAGANPADGDEIHGAPTEIVWDGSTALSAGQVRIAADGLTLLPIPDLAAPAANLQEAIGQVWRRLFKKSTLTTTELKTYKNDDSTIATTQTVNDDKTTQTQGKAV